MKRSILTLLIAGALPAAAQQRQGLITQETPVDKVQVIGGSFRHWGGTDSVNVNYQFSPGSPTGDVAVLLHTPTAQPLWLTINKASGKQVMVWRPEQQNYLQQFHLNVSRLAAGNYEYHICWGNDQAIQVIPFVKQ